MCLCLVYRRSLNGCELPDVTSRLSEFPRRATPKFETCLSSLCMYRARCHPTTGFLLFSTVVVSAEASKTTRLRNGIHRWILTRRDYGIHFDGICECHDRKFIQHKFQAKCFLLSDGDIGSTNTYARPGSAETSRVSILSRRWCYRHEEMIEDDDDATHWNSLFFSLIFASSHYTIAHHRRSVASGSGISNEPTNESVLMSDFIAVIKSSVFCFRRWLKVASA